MKRPLFAVLFLIAALPLAAADFEAGIRHFHLSVMGESRFEGGELDVASSRGFAATGEVFWSERLSTQFAASFVNPAVTLTPNDVDLGTLGIDSYSASLRWHFAPQSRYSPFVAGGVALATFGNLDDQFGDDIEMEFDNATAFFAEAGVRYRFRPQIFVEAGVSYMPLEAEPERVRNDAAIALPDRVQLDPLTIHVGLAWRF